MAHGSLAKDLAHYYLTSEQIPTSFSLSVKFDTMGGWPVPAACSCKPCPTPTMRWSAGSKNGWWHCHQSATFWPEGEAPEQFISKSSLAIMRPVSSTSVPVGFACHCNRDQIRNVLTMLPIDELRTSRKKAPSPSRFAATTAIPAMLSKRHIDLIVAARFAGIEGDNRTSQRLRFSHCGTSFCRLISIPPGVLPIPFAPALSRGLDVSLSSITSLIAINQVIPAGLPLSARVRSAGIPENDDCRHGPAGHRHAGRRIVAPLRCRPGRPVSWLDWAKAFLIRRPGLGRQPGALSAAGHGDRHHGDVMGCQHTDRHPADCCSHGPVRMAIAISGNGRAGMRRFRRPDLFYHSQRTVIRTHPTCLRRNNGCLFAADLEQSRIGRPGVCLFFVSAANDNFSSYTGRGWRIVLVWVSWPWAWEPASSVQPN
jgi:hypothetical protein